jgi:glycosyltransferase involved in cell wall biosynthesis
MKDGMDKSLKVSVIIPTFNRQTTLEKALDSVLGQTYQNFEVLVCDDASTDGTYELVNAYSKKAPQIRLLSLPYNQGAGAARNMAMQAARGEYLAFLDSDDEWRKEKLAKQVQIMDQQSTDVGVCFCGATIIKNGDVYDIKKYVPDVKWEKDTFRKFVCDYVDFLTPTIMIRRSCLSVSGMMVPEMRRNQDGEFLLRLFSKFKLVVIPDDLVIIHLGTRPGRIKSNYGLMKNAYPFWAQHKELVRQTSGSLASIKYLGTRRTNLITSAIRDRLWSEAWRDFLKRLYVSPWLWPGEIIKIMRALYRVLLARR